MSRNSSLFESCLILEPGTELFKGHKEIVLPAQGHGWGYGVGDFTTPQLPPGWWLLLGFRSSVPIVFLGQQSQDDGGGRKQAQNAVYLLRVQMNFWQQDRAGVGWRELLKCWAWQQRRLDLEIAYGEHHHYLPFEGPQRSAESPFEPLGLERPSLMHALWPILLCPRYKASVRQAC